MEEKQLLQVGDTLYRNATFGYGLNKYKVIRVTNTQAIIEYGNSTRKVERQLKNNSRELYCNAIGRSSSWEPSTYRLENDELKAKFSFLELTKKTTELLNNTDCSKLNTDQLQNLHDFLLTLKQNESNT